MVTTHGTGKRWKTQFAVSVDKGRGCQPVGQQIAFYAYMSSNIHMNRLYRHKIFVYDSVETNIGNGYDARTGKFIAPQSGVYVIHTTTVSIDYSASIIEIVKNGVVKDVAFADSGNHDDRVTIYNNNLRDVYKIELKKAATHFFWISIVLIGVSAGSIIFGILKIVYKDTDIFSREQGTPIWSGALLLLSGIFCYFGSKIDIDDRNLPSSNYTKRVNIYRVINGLSLGINVIAAGLSSVPIFWILYICVEYGCFVRENQAWDIATLILSIILCFFNILGFAVLQTYDKALQSDRSPPEGGTDTQRNLDLPQQHNHRPSNLDPGFYGEYRLGTLENKLPAAYGFREREVNIVNIPTAPPPDYSACI
ncbi:uncharacterized protein LOC134248409 [Saccostrea cucullata]|uniref:uncharacterized protein LOC134248409 n=1 Tax=Saccostrea cuccullata TaxID=36930 RepID=UPI002ED3D4C6